MANYNTFMLIDCKKRKPIIITSSARKVARQIDTGFRVEVWNNNELICKIYKSNKKDIEPYIKAEKEYIKRKQEKATLRNKKRKARREKLLKTSAVNAPL